MRNFFRRLRESFSNNRNVRRNRNRRMNDAENQVRRGRVTQRTGFDAVRNDVAMDFGLKEKDTEYYSRLGERQRRSQQALADMRRRRDRRRDRTDDTTETKPTEEVTNVTENTGNETTTLDENTNTALTNVEDISDRTFNNTDNITNYFDNTATSAVNTAAGQEQNQASALTTSVGEAEDEAISYMTTGTASNVLNPGGAQGLLGGDDEDEDDPFNRRKTLIGA